MSIIINLDEKKYDDPMKASFFYFMAEKTKTEEEKDLDTYEIMKNRMLKCGISESNIEISISTMKNIKSNK